MNTAAEFNLEKLASFIRKAAKETYAGGGKEELQPERPGFIELVYFEKKFSYRDSYIGFYRSWGTETVRYEDKPVWISLYGGGMEPGKEELALDAFNFLKQALSQKENNSISFRGPDNFENDDWKYTFKQEGNISQFSGSENIYFKNDLVFTHKIIGGTVKDKT